MIQTTLLPLDKLEQNTGQIEGLPRNPRTWTLSEINRIAASLKETPELFEARPILVLPKNGKYVIIGGNLRYEGCRKNKDKEVPCFVLPEDTPLEKLKELVIKDNGSFGAWDYDALANEWDNGRLPDWGVPVWEMEQEGKEEERKEVNEDDFDEEKDGILVRCKPGDIWQLGDHRLMCGDSTDLETVKTLMGGVKADMVFTDPPYGVSYTEKNEYLNSLGAGHRLTKAIENDNRKPTEMYDFWLKCFKCIHECTQDKMAYYITAPQGGDLLLLLLLLLQAVRDAGFMLKHQLIWNKNNHVLGRCDYHYKHEPIIYGWKIGGTHSFQGKGKFKTSVWDIPKPLKNDLHPTMKPVELVCECLLDNSQDQDSVLDLFGGSGTTLIAAEQLGRKAYLMELDPHYCDVIIARWEKLTGREAQKIN